MFMGSSSVEQLGQLPSQVSRDNADKLYDGNAFVPVKLLKLYKIYCYLAKILKGMKCHGRIETFVTVVNYTDFGQCLPDKLLRSKM